MIGLLVLILLVLGILVLFQNANKASGGWLGTVLLGSVLGLVRTAWGNGRKNPHRRDLLGCVWR